jgi:heme-degrading monooxygenase HmoA
MIARTWHGAVPEAKAEDYLSYFKSTGLADLRATPGNLGVVIFWRVEGGLTHFILTSYWENLEAIEAFAGAEIGTARYYPRDADYLIELEPEVVHYEVAAADVSDELWKTNL